MNNSERSNERLETIALDRIEVGDRLRRDLNQHHVEALCESIAEQGLKTPITVVRVVGSDRYQLVAGWHRVQAMKKLGRTEITAFIDEMSDLDRRLWEIDENLVHADLTELQKAEHLAKRKEIYTARHPETRQGGLPGKAGGGKAAKNAKLAGFAEDTSRKTRISVRNVQRSIRRFEKIDPRVQELIRGTEIADSGVELDELAGMSSKEQLDAVTRVLSGSWRSVRQKRYARLATRRHMSLKALLKTDDNMWAMSKAVGATQTLRGLIEVLARATGDQTEGMRQAALVRQAMRQVADWGARHERRMTSLARQGHEGSPLNRAIVGMCLRQVRTLWGEDPRKGSDPRIAGSGDVA